LLLFLVLLILPTFAANTTYATPTPLISSQTSSTLALSQAVPVLKNPFGVAYDAKNKLVYVTDSVSNSISVLSGIKIIKTIVLSSRSYPRGIVYDSQNQKLFVADNGLNSVTVIDGSTNSINSTITVGSQPTWLAFGIVSTRGYVFVSDFGSGSVSIMNAATNAVVKTVLVGKNPLGIAFGNHLTTGVKLWNYSSIEQVHGDPLSRPMGAWGDIVLGTSSGLYVLNGTA
jgi:YVTN family beta-propeller protein